MSKRRRKPITTYRSRSLTGKSDGNGFSADEGREDSRVNRSGVQNDFQSAKREGTSFQSTEDEGTSFQSTKGEGASFQSTKGEGASIQREEREGTSFQSAGRISIQRSDHGSIDFRHRGSGVIDHDGKRRKVRKSYGTNSFAAAGTQGGFSEDSQKTGEEISSEHSDNRLPLEHPEGGQNPQDKVQDFYRHAESGVRSETGRGHETKKKNYRRQRSGFVADGAIKEEKAADSPGVERREGFAADNVFAGDMKNNAVLRSAGLDRRYDSEEYQEEKQKPSYRKRMVQREMKRRRQEEHKRETEHSAGNRGAEDKAQDFKHDRESAYRDVDDRPVYGGASEDMQRRYEESWGRSEGARWDSSSGQDGFGRRSGYSADGWNDSGRTQGSSVDGRDDFRRMSEYSANGGDGFRRMPGHLADGWMGRAWQGAGRFCGWISE